MSDGFAEIDAMIARIRAIPKLGRRAAPAVADAVRGVLEATVAAGTSPEGVPWELTAEGKRPLLNAATKVAVMAVGAFVVIKLRGVEARHHLGRARGRKVREIIPVGTIPPRMAAVIRTALVNEFRDIVGGKP